jgi:CheY-like chemotaxis protein
MEAGRMKLEHIPFEPLAVLQGSLEAVRYATEEKGLTLASTYTPGIPYQILGDPNRLRQILLNLLQNAVKFTSDGGLQITVTPEMVPVIQEVEGTNTTSSSTTTTMTPVLKFSIADTGVGISPEQQTQIFLKYQQAGASVARNYGGTGLGLTICKSLVEVMGGTIGVESELGTGANFWFTLPIELPPTPQQVPSKGEEEDDEFSQKVNGANAAEVCHLNVLVAEDNIVNQKLVHSMLRRMGHSCTMVENGQLAIDHVEQQQEGGLYDVVLMDIQMPVMDGIEATKRLRSKGYTSLPIIGLTASVHRTDYLALGFTDWIGKPVPMKDLKVKLYDIWKQGKGSPTVWKQ